MIIPKKTVQVMTDIVLEMSNDLDSAVAQITQAISHLTTMSYPCQDFLRYREMCKEEMKEGTAILRGTFSNSAPAIAKTFKDAFEGIASTRDYPNYICPEQAEIVRFELPEGCSGEMFVPGMFLYRMEQGGDMNMEIINGFTRAYDPGSSQEAVFVLNSTIATKDIMEASGGEPTYYRQLDPVSERMSELDEACNVIYQIIEFLDNGDLLAFHAGDASSEDPVLRDRVKSCCDIYAQNLEHIVEIAKDINLQCSIRAYCMKSIQQTTMLIDAAWKAYLLSKDGAKF